MPKTYSACRRNVNLERRLAPIAVQSLSFGGLGKRIEQTHEKKSECDDTDDHQCSLSRTFCQFAQFVPPDFFKMCGADAHSDTHFYAFALRFWSLLVHALAPVKVGSTRLHPAIERMDCKMKTF